ncbi:MAG: energy transducer TonB [Verrucomicrobiota bacterium]|nr:energy transducer TonB [Verrucomicrobiota bacterium]MDQ6939448.1 energy transducer TonB [Verrucomicrobiota bacterium]
MSALLYKQTGHWRIWLCFIGAAAIHLGAVALAEREPIAPTPMTTDQDKGITLEFMPPTAEPPPDPVEPVPEPPPLTNQETPVVEDNVTPPPIRQHVERTQPLVRQTTQSFSGPANLGAAKVLALVAPRPEYPYEARRQKLTGSGVALLSIDRGSGAVTSVQIAQTTGNAILDNAAVSGFRRWRFKPGTVAAVRAPITFTLTGASY